MSSPEFVQALSNSINLMVLFGPVCTPKVTKSSEDEFVDDSGYTVSSHKTLDGAISSADIELANKINILKESGLI